MTLGTPLSVQVVNDPAFFEEWKNEMRGMAGRIARVRGELRASLEKKYPSKDWSFVTKQIGGCWPMLWLWGWTHIVMDAPPFHYRVQTNPFYAVA